MARKSSNKNSSGSLFLIVFLIVCVIAIIRLAWKEILIAVIIFALFAAAIWGMVRILRPTQKFTPESSTVKSAGLEYEHFCAKWLIEEKDFKTVTVTPPSGDFGADLVAKDKNGVIWVFQCKYYQSTLSNKPIQEVVAAKSHYGAVKAGVITNSTFTKKAKQLALENQVVLFERVTTYHTHKKVKQDKPYTPEEMMFYDDMF